MYDDAIKNTEIEAWLKSKKHNNIEILKVNE